MKKVFISLAVLIVLLTLTAVGGVFVSDIKISAKRKEMLKDAPVKVYDISSVNLETLPEPVQRYVRFTFGDKTKFEMKAVEWKERGVFELPKLGRLTMSSWQVSRPDIPKYMWRGKMKKGGGLMTIESLDSFDVDKHDMRARFYGLKTIMRSDYMSDEDLKSLHGYLALRYFGTALNFPWGLVTSRYITWKGIDDDRAEMRFKIGDNTSAYIVSFAEDGRIEKMEGTEFHLHGNDELLKETAYKSDYVEWNGAMVPTSMHYVWEDKAGNRTEYKFKIYDINKLD